MSGLPVVLYHYDASPFATKVKNMLTVKRIPHKRVAVGMTLPRPDLSELLGVSYRRIPILAIGNDVYCDSSLIAAALERRFPSSEGHGTLFPPRKGSDKVDTGLIKLLAMFWTDRALFPLAAANLPYEKFDKSFLDDRAAWMGAPIDIQGMKARQPVTKSAITSHMTLIEEQLSDGREYLLDTATPSLADLSAHFILDWMKVFRGVRDVFDSKVFPATVNWLARVSTYLKTLEKDSVASFEVLSGKDAAKLITSASPKDIQHVGFDEGQAALLKVHLGDIVSVIPSDNAKVPTIGKLIALSKEEVVVQVHGSSGSVACHFPRLNFVIQSGATSKSAL
ncbi:hypothetical protein C8Q75DRAFT_802526 [Abortiporus biennis]|nr:hypothetical protein C8Q75DRAFT_802526 [Abortiporus biennis]